MSALETCSSCHGFLPERGVVCPHCDAPRPRRSSTLRRIGALGIFGGGAFAMTLMACYGAPCSGPDGSCGGPYDTGGDSEVGGDAKETGGETSLDTSPVDDASDAASEGG